MVGTKAAAPAAFFLPPEFTWMAHQLSATPDTRVLVDQRSLPLPTGSISMASQWE
jgi:hypothetical protein